MDIKKTKINVLVPVYKPDEKLEKLLYMLDIQEVKPEKIVLMVTVEKDYDIKEYGFVKQAGNMSIPIEIHTLSKEEFDHGGTRNKGMEYCDADIVVCMTQDAVPEDDKLIKELVRPFFESFCGAENGRLGSSDIVISYGRQMPAEDCRIVERYTRSFNYPDESRIKSASDIDTLGIKTFFASNVCSAYKKDLFEKLGGFPEKTIFNEDMIFAGHAIKAGYSIAYAAEARVVHSHNLSGREQFKRNFDLAVSQAEHPEVFGGIKSESEGIRLVKNTIKYLIKQGKVLKIPGMIYMTGCKYTGYLLGSRYKKLPKKMVVACSLNKKYWEEK